MEGDLLDLQAEVFAWVYLLAIGALASWEMLVPRRSLMRSLRMRWTHNALLFASGITAAALILPLTCVSAAILAQHNNWGVAGTVPVPIWIAIGVAVVALDLTRYLFHRLSHKLPFLWRLHRLHHTDQDVDISTSLRFHPIEYILQAAVNVGVVIGLGLHPIAVIIFESWALAANFFTHANVRLSPAVDRFLRAAVVTPDFHRIHHSQLRREYDANYALLFSWWDRLLGTYVDAPRDGHQTMKLGLPGYEDQRHLRIGRMLLEPACLHRDISEKDVA